MLCTDERRGSGRGSSFICISSLALADGDNCALDLDDFLGICSLVDDGDGGFAATGSDSVSILEKDIGSDLRVGVGFYCRGLATRSIFQSSIYAKERVRRAYQWRNHVINVHSTIALSSRR